MMGGVFAQEPEPTPTATPTQIQAVVTITPSATATRTPFPDCTILSNPVGDVVEDEGLANHEYANAHTLSRHVEVSVSAAANRAYQRVYAWTQGSPTGPAPANDPSSSRASLFWNETSATENIRQALNAWDIFITEWFNLKLPVTGSSVAYMPLENTGAVTTGRMDGIAVVNGQTYYWFDTTGVGFMWDSTTSAIIQVAPRSTIFVVRCNVLHPGINPLWVYTAFPNPDGG